ncbi:hypothetical protein SSCG_03169 [Streptomyces clavuligerus]|nr:hypothetical protein SSCG_03169 [Streptomyces clavuligerus]
MVILAGFGCLTLLLTQVSEILSRVPQLIRAGRQVRQEWRGAAGNGSPDSSVDEGEQESRAIGRAPAGEPPPRSGTS